MLKLKNVVDPRLIGVGLGVFGATFLSTQVTDFLGEQRQPFVREYARELAGAALTIGGTFLMGGSKETRTVGLAVGAAGVSTVASGLVRRLQGKPPAAVGGGTRYTNGYASGSTGGGGSTGGFYDGPPVFTAGANGSERGSFQLV